MSTKRVNKLFLIVTYIVVKVGGRLPGRVVFVNSLYCTTIFPISLKLPASSL